jgi:hypothetical protein
MLKMHIGGNDILHIRTSHDGLLKRPTPCRSSPMRTSFDEKVAKSLRFTIGAALMTCLDQHFQTEALPSILLY